MVEETGQQGNNGKISWFISRLTGSQTGNIKFNKGSKQGGRRLDWTCGRAVRVSLFDCLVTPESDKIIK